MSATFSKPPDVMFLVYARLIGCAEWQVQESSTTAEDAIYWAQRNSSRNAAEFEPGCGREFVAVKRVSTYEAL